MSNFSSIAELRLSVTGAKELLEASKEMDKVTAKTRDYNKETQNAGSANRRAEADAEKFLKKLKDQSETFGKTKTEIMAYRAAQLGIAKDAQPFIDKLSQSESKSVSFKDTLRDLTGTLKGLSGNLSGVAAGGAGAGDGIASTTAALRGLGPVAGTAGGLLAGLAVGIGAVVVAGVGLGAVAAAITMQVAEAAAAIDDLSNETGIAAERISLLKALAHEGGSSFDAWNQAATGLATKLAKQDEESGKVAKAIKELGVETKDANGQQKTHIELMREVVVAAANHTDAAKGQALGLAALGGEYNKLKTSVLEAEEKQSGMYDTMRKTGQLMSTTLAKQSGDFMDKLDHLKGAFVGMATSIATTVLPYLDKFLEKMVAAAQTAAGIIRRFTGNSTASELSGDAMSQARKDVNSSSAAIAKMEASPLHTAGGESAALKSERARLLGAQERLREATRLYEASTRSEADAKTATLAGNSKTENKVGNSGIAGSGGGKDSKGKDVTETGEYKEAMRVAKERQALRIKEENDIADFNLKQMEATNKAVADRKKQDAERVTMLDLFLEKGREDIAQEEMKFNQLGMTTREIQLQNDLAKINLDTNKLIFDLTKDITNQEEKATIAAEARAKASELIANRKSLEGKFAARDNDGTGGFLQGIKNYAGEAKSTFEQMEEVGSRVAGSLENAFTNMARTGKLSFKDLTRSVIADLGAIFAKMVATKLVNMIVGSFTGGAGMPDDVPTRGGRAAGGPVTAGQTTWVGEQGPELVKFGAAGSVIPNHKLSSVGTSNGGNTNHFTINVNGGSTNEETGVIVAQAIQGVMKQMPGMARAQIANESRPGGILNPLSPRAF